MKNMKIQYESKNVTIMANDENVGILPIGIREMKLYRLDDKRLINDIFEYVVIDEIEKVHGQWYDLGLYEIIQYEKLENENIKLQNEIEKLEKENKENVDIIIALNHTINTIEYRHHKNNMVKIKEYNELLEIYLESQIEKDEQNEK